MSHLVGLLALLLAAQSPDDERPRHPLAPSIPLLTKEEYKRIEEVVDRLILYDIGKLKGAAGKKAVEDFNALGHEAIFQLIEGFNRAVKMEASCPCVLIAKKINILLRTSDDVGFLSFIKENAGSDGAARRHMVVVEDLKLAAQLRRTVVARSAPPVPPANPLAKKSVDDLIDVLRVKGPKAKSALDELAKRSDMKIADFLGKEIDAKTLLAEEAKIALKKWTVRQGKQLPTLLQHTLAPVRAAAAEAASQSHVPALISLLRDEEPMVAQAARRSLVRLARGSDFGPAPDATAPQREEAAARWRDWWERRR
ncbi:MAG: hypothetical protein U0793_26705 [Gemmataceae bacterium]